MKKNKAKLAFELLEQEMEVIYKEDLMQFFGGSGGYTWQQFVNDIQSGNFNNVPAGSYLMNNDGSTTIYGGMLKEVVISSNHSSGGYGYSSSGSYSSNGYLNDPYFMNSQFWMGSGYSSGGYSGGGGGGYYYVSPTYVAGTGSISTSSGGSVPPEDCVFQTLGWISAMFGDQSHDSKYYEQYYNFTHPSSGNNVLYNYLTNSGGGVPPTELMDFLNTFFNATDYSGASTQFLANYVNQGISENHELMGVYRTPSGGLHMVNVLSINGSEVSFFDAQNPRRTDTTIHMSKMESFIGVAK